MNYEKFYLGLHKIVMENNVGGIRDTVESLRENTDAGGKDEL